MKTYPEIEQLRALDPVPETLHDPARAEELLRRILAEPRTRPPRSGWRLRPRIGAFALAAAAAVAAAVIVLSGLSGGPSLVDRAYAAVSPGYQVVHELDILTLPHDRGFYERTEGWLLPADGRTRLIYITGSTRSPYVIIVESVITSSGRAFVRSCLSGCRPNSFLDGHSRWRALNRSLVGAFGGSPGMLPGTFAAWFRAAYHDHGVASAGITTLAGKRVARFQSMAPSFGPRLVFWRPGTAPPASARSGTFGQDPYTLFDWYVDPATAQPVGFKTVGCTGEGIRSCDVTVATTRIVTFERLEPTPQNLALLTAPGIPAGAQ